MTVTRWRVACDLFTDGILIPPLHDEQIKCNPWVCILPFLFFAGRLPARVVLVFLCVHRGETFQHEQIK